MCSEALNRRNVCINANHKISSIDFKKKKRKRKKLTYTFYLSSIIRFASRIFFSYSTHLSPPIPVHSVNFALTMESLWSHNFAMKWMKKSHIIRTTIQNPKCRLFSDLHNNICDEMAHCLFCTRLKSIRRINALLKHKQIML